MNYKKKLLFMLVLLILLPVSASAYSFEDNNIYYDVSGNNATVTYATTSYNSYSGSVVIPETVTNNGTTYNVVAIGDYAFYNSTGLSSLTIPNSVTTIGQWAFYGCNLDNLSIGENITSIGYWSVSFPDDLRGMWTVRLNLYSVFEGCTVSSLTWNPIDCGTPLIDWDYIYSVTGGYQETWFIGYVFNGNNLDSITIGEQVTKIPSHFVSDAQITEVTIPRSVTSIGGDAFYNCDIETINWQAVNCEHDYIALHSYYYGGGFGSSKVSRINIDSGVESISGRMFDQCSVDSVVCYATVPPAIIDECFYHYTYTNAVLCVPENAKSAYESAPGWENFTTISVIGGGSEPILGDVNGDSSVNIADVTALIDYLLGGGTINMQAADVNVDTSVNIADVTALIDKLLSSN